MSKTKLWFVLVLSVFIVACASTPSSPRVAIHFPIKVSKEVVSMSDATIHDYMELQDFLFIGHTATDRISTRNREFNEYLGNLKDKIATTIIEQFEAGLKQHPTYGKFVAPETRHVFYIELIGISLVQKNTFSKYYKPHVTISAQLKNENGNVLLSEQESITTFSDRTPEYTLEEYKTDKSKLTEAFMKAATSVVSDILNEI